MTDSPCYRQYVLLVPLTDPPDTDPQSGPGTGHNAFWLKDTPRRVIIGDKPCVVGPMFTTELPVVTLLPSPCPLQPGVTALGLIAEEVEKIYPEMCIYNDEEKTDLLTVDYNRLPILLLAELQKLKARISVLEGLIQ